MLKWLSTEKKKAKKAAEITLPGYPVERNLLRQALTHKSADEAHDNERLEFLGDAVLELVVTETLYQRYPDYSEGQLTRARVTAVSEPTLAEAARRLDLGKKLLMSRGEVASGGRDRPSILSDAFEAVVAAVYLSLGLDEVRRFVLEQIGHVLGGEIERDFKSRLQEFTQETMRSAPSYHIANEIGPAHDRSFAAEVSVRGKVVGRGFGRSKKVAEQAAAQQALEELSSCPIPSTPPDTLPTESAPPSESSAAPASTDSSTESASSA